MRTLVMNHVERKITPSRELRKVYIEIEKMPRFGRRDVNFQKWSISVHCKTMLVYISKFSHVEGYYLWVHIYLGTCLWKHTYISYLTSLLLCTYLWYQRSNSGITILSTSLLPEHKCSPCVDYNYCWLYLSLPIIVWLWFGRHTKSQHLKNNKSTHMIRGVGVYDINVKIDDTPT